MKNEFDGCWVKKNKTVLKKNQFGFIFLFGNIQYFQIVKKVMNIFIKFLVKFKVGIFKYGFLVYFLNRLLEVEFLRINC